ncbi:MAG TPA: hypothetical protein VND64_33485 [Pirellulales bacterium]|nr:hypothetical protein [Pirellulales bacterium]
MSRAGVPRAAYCLDHGAFTVDVFDPTQSSGKLRVGRAERHFRRGACAQIVESPRPAVQGLLRRGDHILDELFISAVRDPDRPQVPEQVGVPAEQQLANQRYLVWATDFHGKQFGARSSDDLRHASGPT